MSILDLPLELLQAILACELSPRDLAVLGRINKTFNVIVVPILYSRIECTWLRKSTTPIRLLLRTILKRPDLAVFLKSLILRHWPLHTWKSRTCFVTRGGSPLELLGLHDEELESVISQATPDPALAESWIAAAREGMTDALVALLLVHLPQLTYLALETYHDDLSIIKKVILHDCTSRGSTSVLQQLQTIKISLTEDDWETQITSGGMDNDAVLAMFYLPNIQHIHDADIANPPSMWKWPTAFTPDLSNLRSLDLESIRETHLGEILMVTPNLRSLSWSCDYEWMELHDSPVIDLDALSAALRHVQRALTHLNINVNAYLDDDTDESDGDESHRFTFRGTMDGLRDMQHLETLQASFELLLGLSGPGAEERRLEDVLPSTLRHLTITQMLGRRGYTGYRDLAWDDEDRYEKIASWLGSSKACSRPYLRSMRIDFGYSAGLWGKEMLDRLRNLGSEAGVDVEIVHRGKPILSTP